MKNYRDIFDFLVDTVRQMSLKLVLLEYRNHLICRLRVASEKMEASSIIDDKSEAVATINLIIPAVAFLLLFFCSKNSSALPQKECISNNFPSGHIALVKCGFQLKQ